MSFLFGGGQKGPVSGNDQIVAMQQQQGQQSKEANIQRNARLGYGTDLIKSLFEGIPSGASTLDLSSIAGAQPYSGTAPGYSRPYGSPADPNAAAAGAWAAQYAPALGTNYAELAKPNTYGGKLANGYSWTVLGDTGGQTAYGIYDPKGNLVTSANSLSDLAASKIYTGGDPSKTTGGFDDAFYNNYRNSITGYYEPQEDQQYGQARSDLSASLARAGQLDSSTASKDIANLARQDALNRAQIQSSADTQTGALRTTNQQNEESALNQLYSTEDPSVAANTAGNMVANAQLTKPLLNPAGALFAPITVGVGNALSGFLNPNAYINPSAGTTASTPSGASGSGQTGTG